MAANVEIDRTGGGSASPALQIRMLGPLTVMRDGKALPLPASRKVRALLAYLTLASQPIARSQLCELLWDVPSDPRGELRWALSKVRSLVDGSGRRRIDAQGDTLSLKLADASVDALEIAAAAQRGIEKLDVEQLQALTALFNGDFCDGLELDRSPAFYGWLTAQRRRFRAYLVALLEQLVTSRPDDEAMFGYLDKWLELAPFDRRVHTILLNALASRGRIREGEEHLEATARLFEAEGLDYASIRSAWAAARTQGSRTPRVEATTGVAHPVPHDEDAYTAIASTGRRASVAVMPFVDRSSDGSAGEGSLEGLAHDVITRLAKLRSLFVIAQGSVFALHERRIGPEEAGRMLNVDYVVSGSVQRHDKRLTVSVELAETRTARIVWAEVFNQTIDDAFLVLDEIGNRIVASIASEIETIERNRAILRPPNSLDAWEAHHRGLWHAYRFNRTDNERAQHFFETAVRLDPTFARAYAGLSFAHFQNAFQGWTKREPEIERAFDAAGRSLMADDRDPAAHWAMGRALWLRRRQGEAIVELEQAIELSPNFALGHYTLAFVHSQGGDPLAAISSSDHSRHLSPFDPLLFGMLGARAMALVRLRRFEEAAGWGAKAAARPNAHAHILAIAAYSQALAGQLDDAQAYLDTIRKTLPRYRVDHLLAAMQFDPAGQKLFRDAAKRMGAK